MCINTYQEPAVSPKKLCSGEQLYTLYHKLCYYEISHYIFQPLYLLRVSPKYDFYQMVRESRVKL